MSDVEQRERAAVAPDLAPQAAKLRKPLREDDGRLRRGRVAQTKIRAAARALFLERGFDGATLRDIAARAGMGASSIYRHFESKEELLIDELAELQEQAWEKFRKQDDRTRATRVRLSEFLDWQHALLVEQRDFSMIALRATTLPQVAVARRVLVLYDRAIGLIAEILQNGRMRGDLRKDLDVLAAARAIFQITVSARIPWANGLIDAEACRKSIEDSVTILFAGIGRSSV